MKKVVLVFSILVLSFCVYAAQIDYIYINNVSSDSFTIKPVRGELFTDDDGNLFAVKSVQDKIVVFDRIIEKNKARVGSELTKTNPLVKARVNASLKTFGADFTVVLPYVYPLEPFVEISYEFGKTVAAMAGFKITCPLSNLSNSSFTLLKNGSISGYGAVGLTGSGHFGMLGGFEYNHIVNKFIWGAGAQILMSPFESSTVVVPKICAGVLF